MCCSASTPALQVTTIDSVFKLISTALVNVDLIQSAISSLGELLLEIWQSYVILISMILSNTVTML